MQHLITSGPAVPWLAAFAAFGLLLLSGAAIHSDLGRRCIPNSLCGAIAVLALVYAVGEGGWSGLPDFAWRLATVAFFALPLALLFVVRAMGGGDVKLLAALMLWVPAADMPVMFAVTVVSGALIAIVLKLLNRVFCFVRADTVPYGPAILAGALCVLLPRFDGLATAVCMPMA